MQRRFVHLKRPDNGKYRKLSGCFDSSLIGGYPMVAAPRGRHNRGRPPGQGWRPGGRARPRRVHAVQPTDSDNVVIVVNSLIQNHARALGA
jgi:hypothetical protein